MATPDNTVIDPFDAATNAKAPSSEYYGEIILDAWHCVLEKGVGKRPYDAQTDDPAKRSTAIDIIILPIAESNLRFSLERKLVAESKAWTGITWPSLQKLGISNARDAKNRFCKVKLAPTGRTWIGTDGEKKEETSFEFVELFASEADCITAYQGKNGHAPAAVPAHPAPSSPNPDPNADPNKKTALTFAKAIVTNLARAEKDLVILQTKVAEKIAAMPMVSNYYTAESPEIMQLIAEALA
jgi:hypothetical protein